MSKIILAALIAAQASAAFGTTAIRCTGATEIVGATAKRPESRIYILDDAGKSVATWEAKSQAAVPYCVHECTTVFGAKHIRIIDEDSSGSLILDIDRASGEVMDIARFNSSRWSAASMETFEGMCSKTSLPKATVKTKF
jgi:hypothetical protein